MNRAFSIYLDVVRFAAAFLVYVFHSNQRWLVHDVLPLSSYGHSSVIVFFVLSGFVIAYISDTKERDWVSYTASRASRMYSVAVPALVLTLILDSVGRQLSPDLYAYPYDHFVLRSISSLLMLNEWWFVSITAFSNVPYWSIGYEVWYYVAFGVVTFLPARWRWWAVSALAFALGPKVLLLAPIWMSGVLLYRWKLLQQLSLSVAWVMLAVSVIGVLAFHWFDFEGVVTKQFKSLIGPTWHTQFTFSKFFISDYLLATLVFMNFAAMRRVAATTSSLWLWIERPVRYAAGFTLTLYLLHQPLFLFWAAVLRGDPGGPGYWLATTALTLLSVLLVAHFTESRRHLLRAWLQDRLHAVDRFKLRGAT